MRGSSPCRFHGLKPGGGLHAVRERHDLARGTVAAREPHDARRAVGPSHVLERGGVAVVHHLAAVAQHGPAAAEQARHEHMLHRRQVLHLVHHEVLDAVVALEARERALEERERRGVLPLHRALGPDCERAVASVLGHEEAVERKRVLSAQHAGQAPARLPLRRHGVAVAPDARRLQLVDHARGHEVEPLLQGEAPVRAEPHVDPGRIQRAPSERQILRRERGLGNLLEEREHRVGERGRPLQAGALAPRLVHRVHARARGCDAHGAAERPLHDAAQVERLDGLLAELRQHAGDVVGEHAVRREEGHVARRQLAAPPVQQVRHAVQRA